MNSLVHACDIGNLCCKYEIYFNWASLIQQEFQDETVLEEENNVPITGFKKYKDYPSFLKSQ